MVLKQKTCEKNKNFLLRKKIVNAIITLLISFDFPIVISVTQYSVTGLSEKKKTVSEQIPK